MDRRDFLKTTTTGGVLAMVTSLSATQQRPASPPERSGGPWLGVMRRLADPVLTNLAKGTLKTRMPVEQAPGADRRSVTHLEALGRLLAGIAPWLELAPDDTRKADCASTTGLSPGARMPRGGSRVAGFLNFTRDRQPLVDAAFLGQGAPAGAARASRRLDDDDEAAPDRCARVDARDRAGLQQLAAVLGDGRSRAEELGAEWDPRASTTRSASTSSGTRATAPTATDRSFTGTTTTAS